MDWSQYQNFSESEFKCHHCGMVDMYPAFMHTLQQIRTRFDKPMIVYSGYRCAQHPVEKKKQKPGEHKYGMAVDIKCYGEDALRLIDLCQLFEIKRLGIMQKGDFSSRFIHIGVGDKYNSFPVAIWTY